jgi:hypothetical protein
MSNVLGAFDGRRAEYDAGFVETSMRFGWLGEFDKLAPATDDYGLGATLYHLLTGRPPIPSKPRESVDSILEKVHKGAITPPRALNSRIPAALEAICQKALALRPEDRFPSAKALAEDVERWLADQPVTARADPALVQVARWARKHRTAVTSMVVLLATGLVATTLGVVLINQERLQTAWQRDRAMSAETKSRANQAKAEEGERKAKQSDAEARSILTFFQNKILAAGRPEDQEGGLGPNVTHRAAINKAEASFGSDFANQPPVEAAIWETLGQSYLYLVEPSRAVRQPRLGLPEHAQLGQGGGEPPGVSGPARPE